MEKCLNEMIDQVIKNREKRKNESKKNQLKRKQQRMKEKNQINQKNH